MRQVGPRNRDGTIARLGYSDRWGEREYLYTFTDLCDRAGCRCSGSTVVCDNFSYILFMAQLHTRYQVDCLRSCECFEEDEDLEIGSVAASANSSIDTWGSEPSVNDYENFDWASLNAQRMRQVYGHVLNTNAIENGRSIENSSPVPVQPPSRLNGGKPCLAGQAAGWVFESGATGRCCPGYTFNALTASEAYVNYGLPINWIVAGVTSVGMCLKPASG